MVGRGAGFLDWGLGKGFPLSFQGWEAGPRDRRLEYWVPGQALLQTYSVTWSQFPQMSKGGLNSLESLSEGDQWDRKVRTWKPLDLESHRPGLYRASCPWLSHLSSLCLTWCLCKMGLTGLQGRGHEMPSAANTLPLRTPLSICKKR